MTTGKLFSFSVYNYKYYHVYPDGILNLGEFFKTKSYYRGCGSRSKSYLSFEYPEQNQGKENNKWPDFLKLNLIYKKTEKSRPSCGSGFFGKSYKRTEIYSISGMIHSTEINVGFDKVFEVHQRDYHKTGGALGISYSDYYYFFYRIRVDDYGDTPSAGHIGSLTVGDSLSDPYTDGYLHSADKWYKPDKYTTKPIKNWDIPADVDVFETDSGVGVFCVEIKIDELYLDPLVITVYKANGNNYGRELGSSDTFNVYDSDGKLDYRHRRLYFDNEFGGKVFIKVNTTKPAYISKYKIRLLKARPVILVHGINAFPQDAADPGTTFHHMRDFLGYLKDIVPCVCYDFPWDSADGHNGKGFEHYVGDDKADAGSLFKFVDDIVVKLHGGYKANIILHSMGGFIVRYQLDYLTFANMINQVLFINSPQYGSDLGNFCHSSPGLNVATTWLASKFDSSSWGTSRENMDHLCRGGETIWKMHNEKDFNIPPSRIAFTVGIKRGLTFGALPGIIFAHDYYFGNIKKALDIRNIRPVPNLKLLIKKRYLDGLKRSDGIVPVTSQNLLNIVPDIPKKNYIYFEKHHTESQKINFNDMDSCIDLYNLITNRMNAL